MPRAALGETAYLERHGGQWRVSVNVPIRLRPLIGTPKLRVALGTDDLALANRLKPPIVDEIKDRLSAAAAKLRSTSAGDPHGRGPYRGSVLGLGRHAGSPELAILEREVVQVASHWRDCVRRGTDAEIDDFVSVVRGRQAQIVQLLVSRGIGSGRAGEVAAEYGLVAFGKGYDATRDPILGTSADLFGAKAVTGRLWAAGKFARFVRERQDPGRFKMMPGGTRRPIPPGVFADMMADRPVPFEALFEPFEATLGRDGHKVSDVPAALDTLRRWCQARDIPPTLQSVTPLVIRDFLADAEAHDGRRGVVAHALFAYWSWLDGDLACIPSNPFAGLGVMDPPAPGDIPRPLTDDELGALLEGDAPAGLADLILVAATTGCRIEHCLDLRAGDVAAGSVEVRLGAATRSLPLHPALADVVRRRAGGHGADEPLFPEWGGLDGEPVRIRAGRALADFNRYRRSLGIRETDPHDRSTRVGFGSISRWFVGRLREAGVDYRIAMQILAGPPAATPGERDAMRAAIAEVTLPAWNAGPAPKGR